MNDEHFANEPGSTSLRRTYVLFFPFRVGKDQAWRKHGLHFSVYSLAVAETWRNEKTERMVSSWEQVLEMHRSGFRNRPKTPCMHWQCHSRVAFIQVLWMATCDLSAAFLPNMAVFVADTSGKKYWPIQALLHCRVIITAYLLSTKSKCIRGKIKRNVCSGKCRARWQNRLTPTWFAYFLGIKTEKMSTKKPRASCALIRIEKWKLKIVQKSTIKIVNDAWHHSPLLVIQWRRHAV